jgi:hypothetical protein
MQIYNCLKTAKIYFQVCILFDCPARASPHFPPNLSAFHHPYSTYLALIIIAANEHTKTQRKPSLSPYYSSRTYFVAIASKPLCHRLQYCTYNNIHIPLSRWGL